LNALENCVIGLVKVCGQEFIQVGTCCYAYFGCL